jgi:hypothetical protein
MIHLDRRAISRINRMPLYPYLFYLYITGHKKKKYFFFMACEMIAPSSHISAALAGFPLDQIFRFDEFGPSEKDSKPSRKQAK